MADPGGAAGAYPLRVQILSFWHTNFSKRSCLGSWAPPPYEVGTPPTGNPGSATGNICSIKGQYCTYKVSFWKQNFYLQNPSAPSPLGPMPPQDGVPGGPMPPGFPGFPVSFSPFLLKYILRILKTLPAFSFIVRLVQMLTLSFHSKSTYLSNSIFSALLHSSLKLLVS